MTSCIYSTLGFAVERKGKEDEAATWEATEPWWSSEATALALL
jgi:hypothetical protein